MVKRRPRKSIEQWKAVIADQQASDRVLSIATIHIDTFSARLEINRGLNGRSIVSADTIAKPQLVKVSTPSRQPEREFIAIAFADVEVRLPPSVQADWFAQVLKGFAIMKMFVEPGDIYLHCGYVDFRKSINGLLIIIEHELELLAMPCLSFAIKSKTNSKSSTGTKPALSCGIKVAEAPI